MSNRQKKDIEQHAPDDFEQQPTQPTLRVVETDFAELADGSLVELVKNPENPSETALAIYRNGEVRYSSRVQSGNRILVPIPRDRHIVRHVRLPRGTAPYKSPRAILDQIVSLLKRCLDLTNRDHGLLAIFVLSTWFIDKFRVAPYLALVGLPRSGKSTAFAVLRLLSARLAYRGYLVSCVLPCLRWAYADPPDR